MNRNAVIVAFAERRDLPWQEISFCLDSPEHTGTWFKMLLERMNRDLGISEQEYRSLYYGIHLLGAFEDQAAADILLKFLEAKPELALTLLGEALGDTIPRVLMATCEGKSEALWNVVRSQSTDWMIREACLRCWVYEVNQCRVSLSDAKEKLQGFRQQVVLSPDHPLWGGWLNAIADLGLTELVPVVVDFFETGQIATDEFGFTRADIADFKSAVSAMGAALGERKAQLQKERGYHPFSASFEDFVSAHAYVHASGDLTGQPSQSSEIALIAAEDGLEFDS